MKHQWDAGSDLCKGQLIMWCLVIGYILQACLVGIDNTWWGGSYRLLQCQRGDEVATCQGTGRGWCGCTLQRERQDLLLKQIDLKMKGTERGIVGVSGVWVSVT